MQLSYFQKVWPPPPDDQPLLYCLIIVSLQLLSFENLTLNFELLSSDLDLDHGLGMDLDQDSDWDLDLDMGPDLELDNK